jgi:hypothetical protein
VCWFCRVFTVAGVSLFFSLGLAVSFLIFFRPLAAALSFAGFEAVRRDSWRILPYDFAWSVPQNYSHFQGAGVMDDNRCQDFFRQPTHACHLRYEALRAVFVDGRSQKEVAELCQTLALAVHFAHEEQPMAWSADAFQLWEEEYEQLTADRPGLGLVTGRAKAQVLRLAMVYALLDQSGTISFEHLKAALEVWRYCQESARHIFGERYGLPLLDDLLAQLRHHPGGLSRTDLHNAFGGHISSGDLSQALETLRSMGRACQTREESGGRPASRWFACRPEATTGAAERAQKAK